MAIAAMLQCPMLEKEILYPILNSFCSNARRSPIFALPTVCVPCEWPVYVAAFLLADIRKLIVSKPASFEIFIFSLMFFSLFI